MDHPNSTVTWEVDAAVLRTGRSKVLRSAVAAAEGCLELWSDFLVAATSHRLRIVVSVTDDPDAEPVAATRFDGEQDRVDIWFRTTFCKRRAASSLRYCSRPSYPRSSPTLNSTRIPSL
jgi:hypothetical protein